jgi:membrane protease YdiL (CAAX protease family)
MKRTVRSLQPVFVTAALAVFLWCITFRLPFGDFWIKISVSASILALAALWLRKPGEMAFRLNLKAVTIGLISAGILYLIFLTGQAVSHLLFPFAAGQIQGIYSLGEGMPVWVVTLLLLLVTGPAEEIYWRGFLQRRLMVRFGGWQGWLMASGVYAGVHIWAWNFMLVGAAGVAGLFWGCLYWRLNNLTTQVVSHAVWSVVIFTVLPTT